MQFHRISLDYKNILEVLTKNDVPLATGPRTKNDVPGGVGRATDYLYLEKHHVGHAWRHRSGP